MSSGYLEIFHSAANSSASSIQPLNNVIARGLYKNNYRENNDVAVSITRFNRIYLVDTSESTVTISITGNPSPGDYFTIVDKAGYAGTYNILVDFLGSTQSNLHGKRQNCTINTNNITVDFIYISASTGWIIK